MPRSPMFFTTSLCRKYFRARNRPAEWPRSHCGAARPGPLPGPCRTAPVVICPDPVVTPRDDAARAARRMWTLFEPGHVVAYFSAEALSAFTDAGLRGFWRGYFAGRAAPPGAARAAPRAP